MRGKKDLDFAKAGYREAVERGDRDEQARWANQVGHACKEMGQYVEALKWFRKDYEISVKRTDADGLPLGNLMPTVQSMGEIYLRLTDYGQALIFQKKHYELAEETNNLVEQQRASTQLGRTYMELYEQKDDFSALQNAKKFWKTSMDLAQTLKQNPPSRDSPSFVKELVDSYNNMGLLMMVIDDHSKAIGFFEQGLRICNEEEIREDDDARSRLHHNLGRLYCERREWEKAKFHTQTDISICQRIPHPQGEAKGFINLGELHFKRQHYEEASRCFERALHIAQSLEDEDDLVATAQKNSDIVAEAEEKLLKLTLGEQQLKKLQRKMLSGTNVKSNHYAEEFKLLNELIGLAEYLQAWDKHLKLAKGLKFVVKEMGDMEKVGDASETIGNAYYNLRNFSKAQKWHLKSFELCKRIGNPEGQSVAMINYGNTLDFTKEWEKALKAYKDAYNIAKSQGKMRMLPQQISALENMQYCYFVRLELEAEAKACQSKIKGLKELMDKRGAEEDEHCSETDNESEGLSTPPQCGGDKGPLRNPELKTRKCNISSDTSDDIDTPRASSLPGQRVSVNDDAPGALGLQERHASVSDNAPLASFLPLAKRARLKGPNKTGGNAPVQKDKDMMSSVHSQKDKDTARLNACSFLEKQLRKRPRVVLLDEDEEIEDIGSETHTFVEEPKKRSHPREVSDSSFLNLLDVPVTCVGCDEREMSELESVKSGSLKTTIPEEAVDLVRFAGQSELQSFTGEQDGIPATVANKTMTNVVVEQASRVAIVHIGDQVISINLQKHGKDGLNCKTVDWLKKEIVEKYNLSFPSGLKPLLRHVTLKGRILPPNEALDHVFISHQASDPLEAVVDCWVPVPLLERYCLLCEVYQQSTNAKLLDSLNESKMLEDKVCASGCNLNDDSAWPLLMALSENGSFSHLDLSHNSLGSRSVQKIQQLIAAKNQPNLGLILDLHNNRIGAASIAPICECPVTLSRLEVLNLSGNKLTDAAARSITNLIKNSQVLEVLKLENCGLTTRSILKISAAIHSSCPMVKLSIGENNPLSSSAIVGLLEKLSCLSNFSELDLNGIVLDNLGLEGLKKLLESSQTISALMLGQTLIQSEGAVELCQVISAAGRMITKLDMSFCGLGRDSFTKFCPQICSIRSLSFMNLSGNRVTERGAVQMASVLSSPTCRLKTLVLRKSQLGWTGMLIIMKSLQGNIVLQKLNLADNVQERLLFGKPQHQRSVRVIESLVPEHRHHRDTLTEEQANAQRCHADMVAPRVKDQYKDKKAEVVHSSNAKSIVAEGIVSDSEDDAEEPSSGKPLGGRAEAVPKISIEKDGSARDPRIAMEVTNSPAQGIVDEFSRAMACNEGLKFLDLSDNGLSSASTQKLYSAWMRFTRWVHHPKMHADDSLVHFAVDEECCGRQPCCDSS